MNKKGHIAFAFLINFAFVILIGWLGLNWLNFSWTIKSVIITIFIILFYSLLPDLDAKNGTMTWIFLTLGVIGVISGIFFIFFNLQKALLILIFSTSLLVVTLLAANFFKHRGIVHTIWMGLLAIIPLWFLFFNLTYCIIAFVSWYSHLLGDGYIFKIR